MSAESWVCRDESQLKMCFEHLRKYWDWSNSIAIKWQNGAIKSDDQRALCHIWIREIQRHMNKTPGNAFTEEEVKTWLKRKYGIIEMGKDLVSGEKMPYLKSTEKYLKGEMYHFMQQLDVFAANIGCILPPSFGGYHYPGADV
jgi:hypothetical protein